MKRFQSPTVRARKDEPIDGLLRRFRKAKRMSPGSRQRKYHRGRQYFVSRGESRRTRKRRSKARARAKQRKIDAAMLRREG